MKANADRRGMILNNVQTTKQIGAKMQGFTALK
jgi:hypothetical protein